MNTTLSENHRGYFLIYRDRFLTHFNAWGLVTRLRHYISAPPVITDRIWCRKTISIECLQSFLHFISVHRCIRQIVYGFFLLKYEWIDSDYGAFWSPWSYLIPKSFCVSRRRYNMLCCCVHSNAYGIFVFSLQTVFHQNIRYHKNDRLLSLFYSATWASMLSINRQ